MDDNELQSLLQQFKAVQKDISQSRQSSDARAAVAADIAKLPPMDEGIDQLKHLEAVDKAMTGAEEEARQQVSHSKKLVSHSEKLCNEMRTRRNAAQQDEDTARQAKTDAEAFKQNLRQVDVSSALVTPESQSSNTDMHRLLCSPNDKPSKRLRKHSKRPSRHSKGSRKHSGMHGRPSKRNEKLSSRTE